MFWNNQYPTKNDMGDKADTFQWHPLATKQFYNDGDGTTDSCGRPAMTMSKPGNLNAESLRTNGSAKEPDYRDKRFSSPWNVICCA